ncbi:hypothetical protein SAMN05880590_104347 [Rhizobium sp. RU35A]|uniref:DUF1206 domain-containing protein n=1 Tax=Rhizobium straminoryzae TaxID=1387186 RepID=A0A549TFQ4_9HYPH|nr:MULTISPECIES: DUF1206 domain-containing protein [Rhizobium]TRL41339.1 DUF1206 domain-containing protein [Rhizobium straminoryzae]SIQ49590.1 hypothetical protein SAMN05880590_104347 [Rhizobium sp. RU35A]
MVAPAALAATPPGWAVLAAAPEAAAAAGTFLVSNPIGWAILGTVAVGTLAYGGYRLYQNAHSESEARFKTKTISDACSTCHDCESLQREIQNVRNEVAQRHTEMREDVNGLFAVRPGPIPGREYLGTWPGHQMQYEGKQRRLRRLLNASATAGCPPMAGDYWKWAEEPTPAMPAPRI